MRKLVLLFIPLIFLMSCNNMSQEYYITLKIDTDENTVFIEGPNSHINTTLGCTISGHYFLHPEKDTKIDFEYLKSLDDSIIEVTEIDTDNQCFKALAKHTGETKIKIQTEKYYSSTSLRICVCE